MQALSKFCCQNKKTNGYTPVLILSIQEENQGLDRKPTVEFMMRCRRYSCCLPVCCS